MTLIATLRAQAKQLADTEFRIDRKRLHAEMQATIDLLAEALAKPHGKVPMNLLDPLEQLLSSIGRSTIFPRRKFYIQNAEQFAQAMQKLQELLPIMPRVELHGPEKPIE